MLKVGDDWVTFENSCTIASSLEQAIGDLCQRTLLSGAWGGTLPLTETREGASSIQVALFLTEEHSSSSFFETRFVYF